MKKLNKNETSVLVGILESVLSSMEQYDVDSFSSSEDLLITLCGEGMANLKNAIAKMRAHA